MTDEGNETEFASYLSCAGIEWSTIIRTDFLTEGYNVLATAGPKKCISAHLYAGDKGGRIIFLPAPYSPDFDRTLIHCLNLWYSKREGEDISQYVKDETAALVAASVEHQAQAAAPGSAQICGEQSKHLQQSTSQTGKPTSAGVRDKLRRLRLRCDAGSEVRRIDNGNDA